MKNASSILAAAAAAVLAATPALAEDRPASPQAQPPHASTVDRMGAARQSTVDREDLKDVQKELDEAARVVRQMKADPEVRGALARSKGVFILPDYGRGAVGVGASGGQGVLVTNGSSGFGNPVFYNMAGLSVGPQVGGAGGSLAFLLMTDKAVQKFRSDRNFSLEADAGLTIGTWSDRAQASAGKLNDIVVWSGTKGAYAGASIGLTGVLFDREANTAWYGKSDVDPARIMRGELHPVGKTNPLKTELSG